MSRVEKAMKLVLAPRAPTEAIVAKCMKIVAGMTPEEEAEFRRRIREINDRPD
jgi:hypothetical protein